MPSEDPYGAKRFLSGGVGGMALVAVGHPLDTLKVKIQTSKERTSAAQVFRQILAKQGVRGLYSGMATPFLFTTPLFAVSFWGYDMGRRIWSSLSGEKQIGLTGSVFAGAFSAIPCTVMMTPIERIKVLLQTQEAGSKMYNGPADVAKQLLRQGGIRSLYTGTVATLIRDVPGSAAYFAAYDITKAALMPATGSIGLGGTLFAGSMAGVANWAVAIPPDVVKSRIQAAPQGTYKGFMDCATKMVAAEGPWSLFRGIGPVMLRAIPANAACFVGAEYSLRALNNMW